MSRRRRAKSASWHRRQNADVHVRAARQDGYRSRAAYKLLEMDDTLGMFRHGMTVIDLGAAPGGWSQVLATRVGRGGRVLAVDVLAMPPVVGVEFVHGDFQDKHTRAHIHELLDGKHPDVIVSDMSPNLTGITVTDQAQAAELATTVLEFTVAHLRQGGRLLLKVFEGEARMPLQQAVAGYFTAVKTLRLKATRTNSRELYLLADGFKRAD